LFYNKQNEDFSYNFSDVVIIDVTHQTNRFGPPLLDIVVIDSEGGTYTCFVAIMKDQTKGSFNK